MNIEDLKKEMPFKWRVQSTNQYGSNCVAYIDARDVQDLLDDVIGAEFWQCKYEEHKGNLFCSIGITFEGGGWIWKSDCGTESNIEKQKGEASDAFKRAAVMWGIGRFLYSTPIIKIKEVIKDGKDRNGKDRYAPSLNGKKIWNINEYCNNLHLGKTQPTVAKNKIVERKPAFKSGGWDYLVSDKATQEHIQHAIDTNRMTPQEKKTLQSKIK